MTLPSDRNRRDSFDPALSRWLDGECESPEEAERVEARLAADPALSAEMESLRGAMDVFRDGVAAVAPDRLAERVLASVARGEDEEARFEVLAKRYAAAAAVLLAVGVGGSMLVHGRTPASDAANPATLVGFEDEHMDGERYVDFDQQPVGGR